MARPADVAGNSADTTVAYDQALLDPAYTADTGDEVPEVWTWSQKLRDVLETKGEPFEPEREMLADAVLQQLQTLGLFREVKLARAAAHRTRRKQALDLYVLLFPGEGRDNTGIKDLNDKVLGYRLNSEFIKDRQSAITEFFWDKDKTTGPRYITVGLDYKTASIVAHEKKRAEFAKDLVKLDEKLRCALLRRLRQAEPGADDAQKREIANVRRALRRKGYQFDFLFGIASIDANELGSELETTFLVLTHALKGAGIARFLSKAAGQETRDAARFARGTSVKRDAKKLDPRGKSFDLGAYRSTTNAARKIKAFVSKGYSSDHTYDYMTIFVDTVWTFAFLYHRGFFGNPDVIRDVRKRLLVKPRLKQGVKYTFRQQVELLELWLVALNELDFVKDFLPGEFPDVLEAYHERCYEAFRELHADVNAPIDWDRLQSVLTHDVSGEAVQVQGNASEYQFYALASDHDQQVFFTMDVRDLGVEVARWYEYSNWVIQEDKLSGTKLMEETFESTKPINQRKRAMHAAVVKVMRKYNGRLAHKGVRKAAVAAFAPAEMRQHGSALGPLSKHAQVMLGGDEVFVAAHPYFAQFESDIIADLEKETFKSDSHDTDLGERPFDLRIAVSYSSAKISPDTRTTSSGISPGQRQENQRAHAQALKLGGSAASALKPLERTQRRIERMIELLEANPKKAKRAPAFAERLAKLDLLRHYVRVQYADSEPLTSPAYDKLFDALERGDLVTAQRLKLVDLVDYSGNVVNARELTKDAAALEAEVRSLVGSDNYHMDGPPASPLAKKIIEKLFPPDKDILKPGVRPGKPKKPPPDPQPKPEPKPTASP
jgi:hypothetical protein